ncbi:hypothetical protein JCGZ_21028 [Jatropha curcas]|uniref:Uncharacterized protein n=1 Tax=Jatropha curcas TaxID=180498 RepID=A0A067K3U6_JATCU|nr:hypothetical protein JCGZ_21028 [Jatropha curcas]
MENQKYGSRKQNEHEKESGRKRETRTGNRWIVEDDKGDINELADAFIKNFRDQLKIQRAESLKRFQEMISRGV